MDSNLPQNHKTRSRSFWKRWVLGVAIALFGTIAVLILTQVRIGHNIQMRPGDKLEGVKYLSGPASALRVVRHSWIDEGRPKNFKPDSVLSGSFSNIFFYTNNIQVGGKLYQCRFGVHDDVWPPGIVAITDDETVLWIRDRDGAAMVNPEGNWIEF